MKDNNNILFRYQTDAHPNVRVYHFGARTRKAVFSGDVRGNYHYNRACGYDVYIACRVEFLLDVVYARLVQTRKRHKHGYDTTVGLGSNRYCFVVLYWFTSLHVTSTYKIYSVLKVLRKKTHSDKNVSLCLETRFFFLVLIC